MQIHGDGHCQFGLYEARGLFPNCSIDSASRKERRWGIQRYRLAITLLLPLTCIGAPRRSVDSYGTSMEEAKSHSLSSARRNISHGSTEFTHTDLKATSGGLSRESGVYSTRAMIKVRTSIARFAWFIICNLLATCGQCLLTFC